MSKTTLSDNASIKYCSVCGSDQHDLYMETLTMMHDAEKETFYFHQCKHCESVFLYNPVDPETLGNFYTDAYLPYRGEKAWGTYANWVIRDDESLNKKRVQLVKPYLTGKAKENYLLDIGCGKPDFLNELRHSLNVNVTGVDFTPAQWEDSKYDGIELIEGDWRKLNLQTTYDVITAWHYLEHDYQLSETVKTCYELLKPGGVLIAEVPMFEGFLQKIQKQFWQGWHSPRHITLFSFKSWKILFSEDKWNHIEHRKYGTLSAFTLWWLGYHEKKQRSWSGSMEKYFWGLVFWKVLLFPVFLLERIIPMGVQIVIIQKK